MPKIISDGTTVWINDKNGYCLGRFGRMGIDIHRNAQADNQCLYCTHQKTGPSEWLEFVKKMKEIYNVIIKDEHKPTYC